jgi:hypothetical protein
MSKCQGYSTAPPTLHLAAGPITCKNINHWDLNFKNHYVFTPRIKKHKYYVKRMGEDR